MRWEYCTKMTFQKSGYAEWHSWATYINKDHFAALFNNYVKSHHFEESGTKVNPNKHLIQIDLAVYDEIQWQKMMFDVEQQKLGLENTMSCSERLSHAIHIDKIKIYPNSTMMIEKTVKRNIIETHDERVG